MPSLGGWSHILFDHRNELLQMMSFEIQELSAMPSPGPTPKDKEGPKRGEGGKGI